MQQQEILFDDLTARDVAERLRMFNEIQAYLNAVVLTVGRVNGAGPQDTVQLNKAGTGVVITASIAETSAVPKKKGAND